MTRPIFNLLKLHGIMFDLDPEDCPPDRWTSGRNVFFKNGEIFRCEGINKVFQSGQLFAAEAVWYVDTGTQEFWYYMSNAGIGVTDGAGNHYDITPIAVGPSVIVTELANTNPARVTVAAADIWQFQNGMTVTIAGADASHAAANGNQTVSSLGMPVNSFILTGVNLSGAASSQTTGVTVKTNGVGWGPIVTKNFIWSIGDINTLPFFNHPDRGAFWHDGDPNHKAKILPDWPAGWSCRKMVAHKNFLFALGIDTGAGLAESQGSWSSSADPGHVPEFWNPSPTNDAGDVTFATPGGPLIGGIGLRDQFFMMKENATYSGQYVGGQWIFQARDVFPSTGMFSPNACVEHDNLIYMLTGRGELVRHDGQSVQNLLYGVAQDYLVHALNAEWPSSIFLYFTDQNGVMAVAYPTGTARACTEALGIEVASIGREGPVDVGLRDLPGVYSAAIGFTEIVPQTWDTAVGDWQSDTLVWNEQASGVRPAKIVFGGGANGMLELGKGSDVLGVAIDAYLERLTMDLGEFGTHKVISGGFPRLRGNAGDIVYYRMGSQEQVRSAVNWGPEMAFTIGTSQQLDFFEEGRLMAYSIRSHGGGIWNDNGIQLMARATGRW